MTYREDPECVLAAAIAAASATAQRSLAAWAAREVLVRAGLHTRPELVDVLRTLDRPTGPTIDERADRFLRRVLNVPSHLPYGVEARAARALVRSAHPHPHMAAVEGTWYAHAAMPAAEKSDFVAEALVRVSQVGSGGRTE